MPRLNWESCAGTSEPWYVDFIWVEVTREFYLSKRWLKVRAKILEQQGREPKQDIHFICDRCGKRFQDAEWLARHRENPYCAKSCPKCGTQSIRWKNDRFYVCAKCRAMFLTKVCNSPEHAAQDPCPTAAQDVNARRLAAKPGPQVHEGKKIYVFRYFDNDLEKWIKLYEAGLLKCPTMIAVVQNVLAELFADEVNT